MHFNFKKVFILLFPLMVVFLATLYQPADSDLGWHLKYGEYFFQHNHILRDNTFSTEMPNFKWPNSSWATDLVSYLTFSAFGFLGLSVLGALVVTLTFYFFSKAAKLDYFEESLIFPYLIVFMIPVNVISFRGQLLSLMLTGILFLILRIFDEKKSKVIYWVIPLFIAWVNLHGQFLIGLGLFYIWVVAYIVQDFLFKKDEKKKDLKIAKSLGLVVLLTTAATLINPFGIRLYEDIFAHFNNADLKSIVEYLPFSELSNLWWNQVIMGFLLFFGLLFYVFSGLIKEKLPWATTGVVLFPMSFWVRRYSWTMYYLTLPLLKPVAAFFKPNKEKDANIAATVIFGITLSLVLWLGNPFDRIKDMTWASYCREFTDCPDKAIQHLIEHKYPGELMTMYNWGGYMIWHYPSLKPSIDGRMHLWKDESGYSAFSYYYPFEQDLQDIDKSKYDVVLMSPEKPAAQRLAQLVNEGKWKMAYFDEDAAVFVREKKR